MPHTSTLSSSEQQALVTQWQYLAPWYWDHYGRYNVLIKRLGYDDAITAGYVGLCEAAKRFDPSKGNKFNTYATWWIRKEVHEAAAKEVLPVHVPGHLWHNRKLTDELERCKHQAIAQTTEISDSDEPIDDDDEGDDWWGSIELLHAEVDKLPTQMQEVVILKWWKHLNYRQIAARLHLSHERIRQLHNRAMAILKDGFKH